VLTTSDSEHDVARAYAQHANSYLVKPAEFARIRDLIDKIQGYWLDMNRLPGDGTRASS
jgi:DNA-binding NarL/FixJ family response regulator